MLEDRTVGEAAQYTEWRRYSNIRQCIVTPHPRAPPPTSLRLAHGTAIGGSECNAEERGRDDRTSARDCSKHRCEIAEAGLHATLPNPTLYQRYPSMAPKAMYYAVAGGPSPGIYPDWPQAQAASMGKRGAKVKKFADKESAEAFVAGVRASVDEHGTPRDRSSHSMAAPDEQEAEKRKRLLEEGQEHRCRNQENHKAWEDMCIEHARIHRSGNVPSFRMDTYDSDMIADYIARCQQMITKDSTEPPKEDAGATDKEKISWLEAENSKLREEIVALRDTHGDKALRNIDCKDDNGIRNPHKEAETEPGAPSTRSRSRSRSAARTEQTTMGTQSGTGRTDADGA